MNKLNTKAVIFDFDGTLTCGKYENFWKSIYQVLGYATDKKSDYYLSYLGFKNLEYDYEHWVKINENDFICGGLTKDIFNGLTQKIKLISGLKEVLETLNHLGVKLYILSGNFQYAIAYALGDLAGFFTEISANEIYFDDQGKISHIIPTKYDFEGKPKFISKIQRELNVKPDEICFVGNGENDTFAYQSGAKTICVNPVDADENNHKKWTHVLNNISDLKILLNYID